MYLINKNDIDYTDWMGSYLWFELIGFWQCSEKERYYSNGSECGRIVPVFVGDSIDSNPGSPYFGKKWKFDTEKYKTDEELGDWVLVFKGCDDGHIGMRFNSREEAIQFIKDCDYIDFADFVHRYYNDKNCGYKLEFC